MGNNLKNRKRNENKSVLLATIIKTEKHLNKSLKRARAERDVDTELITIFEKRLKTAKQQRKTVETTSRSK